METVRFETDLCRSILQGYIPMAQAFLTGNDFAYLFDAIRLIAFELGLRFLPTTLRAMSTSGERPDHNLARALVQFRLTESIESQEATVRSISRDIR
jgi:hypothetical protein